ncbi:CaiB/BaiF CoA transferase family protein [Zoogloea sp.]|uniref:CaiB/BaiF CoA transferase family protein n=1 Tax=Zoogloea sp. TaxID=49181 RepID=UPI0035B4C585
MVQAAKPLAGVKVLELGTLIAGPFCTRILAEFGAEVIKVESPDGGDPLRQWRKLHEGTSLWWSVQARNKRSFTANLKDPDGLAAVRRLAAAADIVVENFRPGVLEKLGLGWDVLSAANPGLVMVRLSGFGQTGPYKDRPGFGAIGESMGGLRYITGFPDRPPVRTGISIGDSIAALWAAIGALMALRHREVNGGAGQVVDVALYEAVFAMMESMVPEFDVANFVRERTGNVMPGITPSNTHTTRDGRHIIVGGNGDAIFKRLMLAVGRPDLADDPGLASNAGRDARAAELYAVIDAWVAARDGDVVLAAMEAAQVPASPVYSVADMFEDAQFIARDMFEQVNLPGGQPMKIPGIVPKLSDTPGSTEWLGPKLGEHTDEILAGLGYSPQEIVALREKGAV